MTEAELYLIGLILLAVAAMLWAYRRVRRGSRVALRPLPGYRTLQRQLGLAVESGRRSHFTLGRGPLHRAAGPSSVAALKALDSLTVSGGRLGMAPRVTVGAATLWPAAQDSVRRAHEETGPSDTIRPEEVEFLADDGFPFAYAAGATYALSRDHIGDNVALGRFGQEIIIINEAAYRSGQEQVTGTDDPLAMALATAAGAKTLWGEELFVAGAYLEETAPELASVLAQDLLRWVLVAAIIAVAVLHLLASL